MNTPTHTPDHPINHCVDMSCAEFREWAERIDELYPIQRSSPRPTPRRRAQRLGCASSVAAALLIGGILRWLWGEPEPPPPRPPVRTNAIVATTYG